MKNTDAQEFYIEVSKLTKELTALEKEKLTVSPITARFDEIIQRKNAIRIRLKCIQIRWQNLGNLTGYALPDAFNEIPKF